MDEALQLRTIANLPIGQLASLIGVSRQAYHKWLQGKSISPAHQARLKEMIYIYQMKGWLRSAESLTWDAPRLTEGERDNALDQLSPRPAMEDTIQETDEE